jgi:hypothetical protein
VGPTQGLGFYYLMANEKPRNVNNIMIIKIRNKNPESYSLRSKPKEYWNGLNCRDQTDQDLYHLSVAVN